MSKQYFEKHQGIGKNVWLSEEDYDFVNKLKDKGFNFSRYVRKHIKSLRELDQDELDDLTHFLRTSPDKFLQYDQREQPTQQDKEWRDKWDRMKQRNQR